MSFAPDEFASWLEAARAGSKEALGELLEESRAFLMILARQHLATALRSKVGASDLVEETLLIAVEKFVDFEGCTEKELVGWLASILVHLASDVRKFCGTSKRNIGRESPLQWDIAAPPAEQEKNEETDNGDKKKIERLKQTFHLLPKVYQQVVKLHLKKNKTFAEIALIMKRWVGAVKKLWHRALRYWIEVAHLRNGK